jgi:hypothetical protein
MMLLTTTPEMTKPMEVSGRIMVGLLGSVGHRTTFATNEYQ